MNTTIIRRLFAVSLATILLLVLATGASAHEHREVGEYEIIVGFMSEPALVNEPNGLSLAVHHGHGDGGHSEDAEPVEGLQDTLQAEISYGGETQPLELRAQWGQPGSYTADVFPTAEGTYSFRIFGMIEETEIDETFVGGPDTFSEVHSKSDISFPSSATGADSGSSSAVTEAQDSADSARTLAIIGIIVGILGLAAGAAGVMMAMNARSAQTPSPAVREAGD